MKFLGLELKRSLLSFYFVFPTLVVLVFYILAIQNEFQFGHMEGTLYLMNQAHSGATAYVSILAPIIATIPFAGTFSIERNTGFLPFIFTRINKRTYILSKLLAVGMSGALVLALPYLMLLMGVSFNFTIQPLSNPLPGPFGDLAQTSPVTYLLILFIMTFIFGFVYALLGLAVSTLFKQTLFAHIVPFAFYLLPAFVLTFFNLAFLEPATTWSPSHNSLATVWTIGGQIIVLLAVTVIIFSYKIKKIGFPNE